MAGSPSDRGSDPDKSGSGIAPGEFDSDIAPDESGSDTVPEWLRDRDRVVFAVVGIAIAALVARFVALGARPAHFDEARVAYWSLYTQQEGHFAYRSIIHGPFIQHVDRWLFGLVEPSDFTMRIPVAIVGGLFPLSALLYRHYLRREETVALALLLAFNPVLLYYSRFMRSDVLVGAFMFTALGLLIRLLDRRKLRYLYGATFFLALGVAAKENSIVYLLTWAGAGTLVSVFTWLGIWTFVHDRLLRRPEFEWTGIQWPPERLSTVWHRIRRLRRDPVPNRPTLRLVSHGVAALVFFGILLFFMFAPRGDGLYGMQTNPAGSPSVGLWTAVGDPGQWPALFDNTISRFLNEYPAWGDKADSLSFADYQQRLTDSVVEGLYKTSAALSLLAVVGFIREWYTATESRALVFFFSYAGAASVIGYPAALSIGGGWKWNNAHVLIPLAVPAAVGFGLFYRWGREAVDDRDLIDIGLTSLILLLLVTSVAWNGVTHVYTNPQHESNELVQFAQPHDDLDPMLETLQDGSRSDGLDVIVYSESGSWKEIGHASMVNTGGGDQYWNVRPACTDLSVFLPAHWYFETAGVNSTCDIRPDALKQRVQREDVPVVVTKVRDDTVPREWLRGRFTHVGNFSLRWTDRGDPTLEVWSRTDET